MGSAIPDKSTSSRSRFSSESLNRHIMNKSDDHVLWAKKMSNNCAVALLIYTLLQIFVVISAIESKGMSIAPYFGLVLLVILIIPFCRRFEQKWENRAEGQDGQTDQNVTGDFRRDQLILWALAIGLPFAFVALFKCIALWL